MIEEHDHQYRTGIGTDIHRIGEGRKLMLGGVYIPDADGLEGHSDGDVVIHAVVDALFGAAGMGDIGTAFPDTDPQWKDNDSKEFLLITRDRLVAQDWEIVNIDVTIHTEGPRLEPYKGQMKRCISGLLSVDFGNVNIKAKTNEGLGPVGEEEAMAATAIALIKKKYRRTL